MEMSRPLAGEHSLSDRVSDRVPHLIRRRQHEVDRIVRILRSRFVDERPRSPKRGNITVIYLVGERADMSIVDREDGSRSVYEIWAVVDHPEFRGREKSWGPALRLLDSEIGDRCGVELSVFDDRDLERAIRENGMIREKAGSAIVLYDGRAPDSPSQSDLSSSSPYISS